MSYAPASLLSLRDYLITKTNLSAISLGIVGNTAHVRGYHLGKDRIFSLSGQGWNDYSVKTTRDKNGLTSAASAMDIGNFPRLRSMSIWLVKQCQLNAPGTSDIREVIYSPDGIQVLRYDRERGVTSAPRPNEADDTHRFHTHVSWYRDSQTRNGGKISLFKKFFEPLAATHVLSLTGLTTFYNKDQTVHGQLRSGTFQVRKTRLGTRTYWQVMSFGSDGKWYHKYIHAIANGNYTVRPI